MKARVPLAAEAGRARPHRQRGRPHRRPRRHRPPAALGRGRHHPDRARHRPVPAGRDAGAVASPRSACRAWSRWSTPSASTTASATCTTTTSRRSPPVRRAGWVRRSAARSVTARWPSGRSLPVLPSAEEWPYTLRVVSDVLASNGSTSMASVCGSTLSLMDAGVPIKAPVAGIAMGLVLRRGQVHDAHRHPRRRGRVRRHGLQGRRHAPTSVTALQLDTKIDGIPADVLGKALLPGERGAAADPRGDGRARSPSRATTCGRPHRRSSASRSRWTRSAR